MARRSPRFPILKVACGLASAFLCATLLVACAVGGSGNSAKSLIENAPPSDKPSVKIGLLVPLSAQGQSGVIAKSLKQAAELALFERDNPNLQLTVKDDRGTPEGAKAAAEDMLKSGATLILGPLFAKSVAAVAPVARKANVPVVAFSNDRQVAGNGVYLLSFQPGPEITRVVAYAAQQGKRRYAALFPQDALGKIAEPVFKDAVSRAGGTIAVSEAYPAASARAMLEPLQKIAEAIRAGEAESAPIDALFVPGGQENLEMLARLLPQAQIDTRQVRLIGTGGMDYPNAGRDAALIGAWYPGPDPRGWSDFAQRYAKSYGQTPPRIASLAYDAVNLAIALAGGQYAPETLTRAGGYTGVDGPYRLLPDGTTDRSLAILEVQQFGASIVDAAPSAATPPPAAAASSKGFGIFNLLNFQ